MIGRQGLKLGGGERRNLARIQTFNGVLIENIELIQRQANDGDLRNGAQLLRVEDFDILYIQRRDLSRRERFDLRCGKRRHVVGCPGCDRLCRKISDLIDIQGRNDRRHV
ncbi:hypothetical protein D3C78_1218240 [compost metagenome]